MNIRGVFPNRLLQQGVDQANNRRVVFLLKQVSGLR